MKSGKATKIYNGKNTDTFNMCLNKRLKKKTKKQKPTTLKSKPMKRVSNYAEKALLTSNLYKQLVSEKETFVVFWFPER